MRKLAKAIFVALYLLVGIWFGSLNYEVVTHPEKQYTKVLSDITMKQLLFPASSVMQDGGLCGEREQHCLITANHRLLTEQFNMVALMRTMYSPAWTNYDFFAERVAYQLVMTIVWPLKIIVNILVVLIFLLTATMFFVVTTFWLIFCLVLYGAISYLLPGVLRLVHFLL